MNCAEVQELLGAFALESLDADERADVLAHLESCELHDEARELVGAGASLPFAVRTETPSTGLRGRVLAAIEAEPPRAIEAPPFLMARQSRRMAWAPYALAAAFALISIGMLAWNVVLLSGGDDAAGDTRVVLMTGTAGSGAVVFEGEEARLVLAGLEDIGDGFDYQAWRVVDGVASSAGLVEVSGEGSGSLALGSNLPEDVVIAITVEPKGGSQQPTTEPVLVAEI